MMTDFWLRMPVREWLPTSWYRGFLDGLPDLCVGRLPAAFGRSGINEWKVWIVETLAERAALIHALSRPVPMCGDAVDFASGPDAAVSKVDKNRHYGDPVAALYVPQEAGWPWISLFRLPSVAAAGPLSRELGRGVYSYEIDTSEAAAQERLARMQAMAMMAGNSPKFVTPDRRSAS